MHFILFLWGIWGSAFQGIDTGVSEETYPYFLTTTVPGKPVSTLYITPVYETDTYISASFIRNSKEEFVRQIQRKNPRHVVSWFDTQLVTASQPEEASRNRKLIIRNHQKPGRVVVIP